jgi:hypothetical protein
MVRYTVRHIDVQRCANCQTERFPLRARHLCGRCYYALRKLEQADQAVPQDVVKVYKEECQRRLDNLKAMEQKRKPPISGLDVESQLAWLAKRAGVRRNIFDGMASSIAWHFTEENLVVLYGLLSEIEENIQWAGVDWGRIYPVRREKRA